jgi:uncharacterized membrane protein YciS (DUF1049 family)
MKMSSMFIVAALLAVLITAGRTLLWIVIGYAHYVVEQNRLKASIRRDLS